MQVRYYFVIATLCVLALLFDSAKSECLDRYSNRTNIKIFNSSLMCANDLATVRISGKLSIGSGKRGLHGFLEIGNGSHLDLKNGATMHLVQGNLSLLTNSEYYGYSSGTAIRLVRSLNHTGVVTINGEVLLSNSRLLGTQKFNISLLNDSRLLLYNEYSLSVKHSKLLLSNSSTFKGLSPDFFGDGKLIHSHCSIEDTSSFTDNFGDLLLTQSTLNLLHSSQLIANSSFHAKSSSVTLDKRSAIVTGNLTNVNLSNSAVSLQSNASVSLGFGINCLTLQNAVIVAYHKAVMEITNGSCLNVTAGTVTLAHFSRLEVRKPFQANGSITLDPGALLLIERPLRLEKGASILVGKRSTLKATSKVFNCVPLVIRKSIVVPDNQMQTLDDWSTVVGCQTDSPAIAAADPPLFANRISTKKTLSRLAGTSLANSPGMTAPLFVTCLLFVCTGYASMFLV